jgi:hypothetical protein
MASQDQAAKSNASGAGVSHAVADLVEQIRNGKEDVRAKAWQHAFIAGPGALDPLAALIPESELEVGRAARRAMWKIVRHAGRPGAEAERAAAERELLGLCRDQPPAVVARDVVWMLSELGGDHAVAAIARLLASEEVREDARMALERIPGEKSLTALQAALADAPDEFKLNLAQSLRRRGEEVAGLPCRKLVPTRGTKVTPVGR